MGFNKDLNLIIKGLNDPKRQDILQKLWEKKQMTFIELKNELGMDDKSLKKHLDKLIECLLVERFICIFSKQGIITYYKLSTIGERMVSLLLFGFYGFLFENSHKIANKIKCSFNIGGDEKAEIDGFLEEFSIENESSADLIRRIREGNF